MIITRLRCAPSWIAQCICSASAMPQEVLAQPREIDRISGDPAEGDAHEEPPGEHVVELLHLHDVEPVRRPGTR